MISAYPSIWSGAIPQIAHSLREDSVADSHLTSPSLRLLQREICEQCPSGPTPLLHKVCQRCVADATAVEERTRIADSTRDKFVHRGVNFVDAHKYYMIMDLLPREDPSLS